jgi:peptide/nickel transport system permease protein
VRALLSDRRARAGLTLWVLLLVVAFAGPFLVEHLLGLNSTSIDYNALAAAPSAEHPLGTTASGQDVLAQTVAGARASVLVGLGVGVATSTLATLVGLSGAYLGGRIDSLLNGITNVALTLAGFPLLILIASYLSGAGLLGMIAIIAAVSWPGGARVIRAQALSLRSRDFITSMRLVGESRTRLIFIEMLPHLFPVIATQALFGVIGGVFAEAGLSFLGIATGASVSWGTMIAEVQADGGITRGLWWWFMPPGLGIALLGAACGLVNFGIDGLANPRLRARRQNRRGRGAHLRLVEAGGAP